MICAPLLALVRSDVLAKIRGLGESGRAPGEGAEERLGAGMRSYSHFSFPHTLVMGVEEAYEDVL